MRNLVPHFILKNFARHKFAGHFSAVSLFIDTSGFTQITAALQQHGQEGAEVLAGVLRAVFEPFIQAVYAQGGFVANFSGDGFTALFPGRQILTYQRALAAAWQISQHNTAHPGYDTRYGAFTFTVKASLADGQVQWGIFPAEASQVEADQHIYYFCGQAIDRCIEGEQIIEGGQMALSQTVYAILRDYVVAEPVAGYLRVKEIQGELPLPQPVKLPSPGLEQTAFFAPALHQLTMQGEFRQVVTMFINLQALAAGNPLPEFIKLCLRLLREYGGHLARIARIGGQDAGYTLLLFWGAPISFENNVERALNFILDLRQATPAIPCRVGLTYAMAYAGFVGSTLREEYTCYGLRVNQAARQMVAAAWGEVWLDEAAARQSRAPTRQGGTCFAVDSAGLFAFKGFNEKQPVYVFRGRKAGAPVFFLGSLVGRQRELTQLGEFIQPIFERQFAGVITIYGEAGIGKSRLLYEFKQHCETYRNGDAPAWFHCPANEVRRQSLHPWRYFLRIYFDQTSAAGQPAAESKNRAAFTQKLETLCSRLPNSAWQTELVRARPFLAALVDLPWPDSLYEQLEPPLRFENTLAALKNLLLAESQLQPVILVLEDAQWLDDDSAEFLKHLTRNVATSPLAVLLASRVPLPPDLLDPATPCHVLRLESLATVEIQALAEAQLSAQVGSLLVELLASRTGGNPFFVEQLLHYLVEQGLLSQDETGLIPTETNGRLPADVRAVLIARLDGLSPAAREVVQTAAVLGREFDLPLLARMMFNDPQLEARVQEVARAVIWLALTETRYLFTHALMRDAVYDMQLRANLRALHRLAGESIKKLYADDVAPYYADLVYHYGQAGEIEQERSYAKLAGEQAATRYANAEAIAYLSRALDLTPPTDYEERYALLMAREKVYDLQGQREARRENLALLAEVVAALPDAQKQAQVAVYRSRYARSVGDYSGATAFAQTVLDLSRKLGDRLLKSQGLQNLGLVARHQGDYVQARAYFEQALHLYQELGDRPGEAAALGNLGGICNLQGDFTGAQTYHQQGLRLARELNYRQGEGLSLNSLGNICGKQGDYAQAQHYYEQALRIFHQIGYRAGEGLALQNLGNISLLQGDYAAASTYLEQSLAIRCELGDQASVGQVLISLAGVSYKQGDYALARTYFEQALQISRKIGDLAGEAAALHNLGLMAMDQGEFAQARVYFEQTLSIYQAGGNRHGQAIVLKNLENVRQWESENPDPDNSHCP
ncbi:MAG: tetratricopeptide repeat protein [Anaerolineae bacterium]|nr:tetratricopeptide repeat protein [Anaerolineae bacterium]